MVYSIEYFRDAFRGTVLEQTFASGLIMTFNIVAVICTVLATMSGSKKQVCTALLTGRPHHRCKSSARCKPF